MEKKKKQFWQFKQKALLFRVCGVLKEACRTSLGRRSQVACQAAGLSGHSWLDKMHFVSPACALLCTRVKVLGKRVWLAECRACARTLAVAGLRGRISRRSLQRSLWIPWCETGTWILPRLHFVGKWYQGRNRGAVGKYKWRLSIKKLVFTTESKKDDCFNGFKAHESMSLLSWYLQT